MDSMSSPHSPLAARMVQTLSSVFKQEKKSVSEYDVLGLYMTEAASKHDPSSTYGMVLHGYVPVNLLIFVVTVFYCVLM